MDAPVSPTRVEICTGGHQVTVECGQPDASWQDVLAAAFKLWQDTGGPAAPAVQETGFVMPHLSEPVAGPLMGPEFSLPYRMLPDGGDL